MASILSHRFQLTSTQTAVALIVPSQFQPEINSLRKIHDKAYRKWEPHINILYPFVDPSQLGAAITALRKILQTEQVGNFNTSLVGVGTFTHRRNATVFLKPSLESEKGLCHLRGVLVRALGCDEKDGTHDGTFKPHLTMGQAGLKGVDVERLVGKVEKLVGLEWEGKVLAVLKREGTGEMRLVEELALGGDSGDAEQSG